MERELSLFIWQYIVCLSYIAAELTSTIWKLFNVCHLECIHTICHLEPIHEYMMWIVGGRQETTLMLNFVIC